VVRLPPPFTQRAFVLVAQCPPWLELRRQDDVQTGLRQWWRMARWHRHRGTSVGDATQRGERLVDRLELLGELFALRLEQADRVVQINLRNLTSIRSTCA
jgi:hypothetical protein